jgi:5-methyltetrahydrofolate--homocysteine methyltransferase
MSRFLEALKSDRVLLMDGAMGTELQKRGLRDEENAATWNVLRPKPVEAVHRAYLGAGAKVLLTNSFMIHAVSYFEQLSCAGHIPGYPGYWCEALARTGSGNHFRLASMGPVCMGAGREFDWVRGASPPWPVCPRFHGDLPVHEDPDAILLETCSTPRVRYAIRYIRQECDWPVLLSLTFLHDKSGKLVTFSGHTPEWFARRAKGYGVAALGVNCGRDIDMDDIIEIVSRYHAVTDLPLFARPNAGTPTRKGKRWAYPHTPKKMAAKLHELLEAGVSMVGGCCGTTPSHIAAFRPIIDGWNARRRRG